MKERRREHSFFLLFHAIFLPLAALFPFLSRWLREILPMSACLMKVFLRLYCPFCGGTRAMGAILRLQLAEAWQYNPLVVIFLGVFLVADTVAWIRFVKGKEQLLPIPKNAWIPLMILLVGYTLLRNLLMIVWGIDPVGDLSVFWNH